MSQEDRETIKELKQEIARLKENNKAVVKAAYRLLSNRVCDKHNAIIRSLSFAEFVQMETKIGCAYCLREQTEKLAKGIKEIIELEKSMG